MKKRTGRPCTTCRHPKRAAIEKAVREGQPVARVAASFGVPETSLRTHVRDHVPKVRALAVARTAHEDLLSGVGIEGEVLDLHDRTIDILRRTEKTKRLNIALGAIREARANLELLGKLTGRVGPEARVETKVEVTVGVVAQLLAHPDYHAFEEILFGALKEHPAALASVRAALVAATEARELAGTTR